MIYKNLRKYLKRSGLTQERLAEKIGYSRSAVNDWVAGKTVPNAYALLDIAKALKISVLDLYGESLYEEDYK